MIYNDYIHMQEPNTEQSFMKAVNIGQKIQRIGPRSEQLIAFTDKKNGKLWQSQPYQHEYALTKMLVGFQENNQILYPQDLSELIDIFQWIKELDLKQFPKQERIFGRPDPLFLSDSYKKTLEEQLKQLQEKDFLQRTGSMEWLNSVMTWHVQRLMDAGIIRKDSNILISSKNPASK